MQIFDVADRTDSSPAYDTEDSFHFLNRVAGAPWQRVRELVDSWFAEYPPDAKPDLRSRFREPDFSQHFGAWWELYIYTLHRRLGYDVRIHPTLPNTSRQPDFLVTRGDEAAYVECVVHLSTAGASTGRGGEKAWIFEATNKARSPNFMVDIDIHRSGTQRPKASEIVRPLERWLSSLDPDEVLAQTAAGSGCPELLLRVRDWTIEYGAWPVAPDRRGEGGRLIGIYPMISAFPGNEMERFRDLIKFKGGRYGLPDKPLTVAVLNTSIFIESKEVTDALFGSAAISYIPGQADSVHGVRRRDGYWRQGPPRRGSRVTAVLVGHNIYPWRINPELSSIWTNPWAERPASLNLPLLTHTARDSGEVYEVQSGALSNKIFELADDWPGFPERGSRQRMT